MCRRSQHQAFGPGGLNSWELWLRNLSRLDLIGSGNSQTDGRVIIELTLFDNWEHIALTRTGSTVELWDFACQLDDVRIYDRVLSEQELETLAGIDPS